MDAAWDAVDEFAGPGGWEVAMRMVRPEATVLGIELDGAAVATRSAAAWSTWQTDVAAADLSPLCGVPGLIGSPPCQAWSAAGSRLGELDRELVMELAAQLGLGRNRIADAEGEWADPRSALVLEPLRAALELRPEWVALEQVPQVLDLWELYAVILERLGYSTWTGCVSAEQFGVPQTRRRAFLAASRVRTVAAPVVTHQRYLPPRTVRGDTLFAMDPDRVVHELDAELLPWVSMAEGLGWVDRDDLTLDTGQNTLLGSGRMERYVRPVSHPSPTVTSKACRQWTFRAGGARARATERSLDEPAPTLLAGKDHPVWVTRRPATTVACDPRVHPPGHKENRFDEPGRYQRRAGTEAIKVTPSEAARLQGFPDDFPWQGTKTKQHEQIGNAVPPPMAAAILRAAMGEQR